MGDGCLITNTWGSYWKGLWDPWGVLDCTSLGFVCYDRHVPPKKRTRSSTVESPVLTGVISTCSAMTTSGRACKRPAVRGLTVCKSHGGGTAASVRKSVKARVTSETAQLWGLSTDTSSVSIVDELNKLARNKLTDIVALRVKISSDRVGNHIGRLTDTVVQTEYDIEGTVQSKYGQQETTTKKSGTSAWVQELHKAEQELLQIFRLLHEVTGTGDTEQDDTRVRMQVAREAARLMKGFPGMSVEDVAAEVGKRS